MSVVDTVGRADPPEPTPDGRHALAPAPWELRGSAHAAGRR
ncbi:hypothetical protein OHU34_24160 [Streptomyces sp. NBC_00080]|nr:MULTISPECIES: hypothetical protein [Streptomyces]TQJ53728.1 hypothetical protein FBY34_1470 [Streptomyces sp. SLBN-115]